MDCNKKGTKCLGNMHKLQLGKSLQETSKLQNITEFLEVIKRREKWKAEVI